MAHINQEQRYIIFNMLENSFSREDIALAIGKDKSVLCREIQRNADQRSGQYRADLAQKKYEERKRLKPRRKVLTGEVLKHVETRIKQDLSPEQIVGEAKVLGIPCASHETIYKHIWADKQNKGELFTHLRRKGRRYQKRGAAKSSRGIIPNRRDISERPAIVEEKSRFGDLELDTMHGKDHRGGLVTANDRLTGIVRIRKVESREAHVVARATTGMLYDLRANIYTITSDNGKEFTNHELISDCLNVDFFFARPYHSWERGANENVNGLIRQYFPKKTDFTKVSESEVKRVEEILNNRPRKRLGFRSPNYIFEQLTKVTFVT